MSKYRPFRRWMWLLACLLFGAAWPAAASTDFDAWLKDFERDALAAGVSQGTLRQHLEGLEPIPRIIELDRAQAPKPPGASAGRPSVEGYLRKMVPPSRIRTAREKFGEHRDLLQEIGAQFNVDPAFVVALWAIESDFGRRTGTFPLVGSLATLAHEGRRGAFFRGELLKLLELIDRGDIRHSDPRGSWAGAMGQVQFMPSSYDRFALDYDGDGHCDLWDSTADALASAASYLAQVGWRMGEGWGQEVEVPENLDRTKAGLEEFRTLKEWRRLGVLDARGPEDREAALIFPEGAGTKAYLVYENFTVLRHWNQSNFFALAVCHLAEEIGDGDPVSGTRLADRRN